MTSLPIRAPSPMTATALAAVVKRELPVALRTFLPMQRWFGAKDRRITDVTVADVSVSPSGGLWYAAVIVDVGVDQIDTMRYLLPLVTTPASPPAGTVLLEIETPSDRWSLCDAFSAASFPDWLLHQISDEAIWTAEKGQFRWIVEGKINDYLGAAHTGPSRVVTADQSNSAVIFGDALFLKLFRRLRPGVNPDEEVGRFLSLETSFRHLPRLMATGRYEARGEPPTGIGIVQTFVPSVGDGWSWMLHHLTQMTSLGPDDTGVLAAGLLGQRTGELHATLASASHNPDFRAEAIGPDDTARWTTATSRAIEGVRDALQARRPRPPASSFPSPADAIERELTALHDRASGYIELLGHQKIRVHGDYHLGQTLRTVDDDWTILDFEGEPNRTIDERSAKTSPLKDVAGMLRSFAYARATAGRNANQPGPETDSVLAEWERAARTAFLREYRRAAAGATNLVPTDDVSFARALAAWELDKTLYEVLYELGNRPDWLEIPLRDLVASPVIDEGMV